VKDKKVFLVCTLNLDTKLLPLYFWRRPQKNLEPKAFVIAPYLAYMPGKPIEVKVSPQRILQI
jgi:hypothetical protein